ncbi:MAG: peptidoglycan DD-metalloendopeptidase family protein [Actinomycetota bacterium]
MGLLKPFEPRYRPRGAPAAGTVGLAVLLVCMSLPAIANPQQRTLIPPVDAAIARGFDLPKGQFGPGNRGLDYAVVAGAPVRAAGSGTVTFAGPVAGTVAVTLDHEGGLETTYTGMRELYVVRGETIDQGHWLGETDDRFHFGVKLDDIYVDPKGYLGPIDTGDAIHLIPVTDDYEGTWGSALEFAVGHELEGLDTIECTSRELLRSARYERPPNDNVAISIGGINENWERGAPGSVSDLAPRLGYERERSYVLSYSDDPDAYDRADTFGDLRSVAHRLDRLLQRIAAEFPDTGVDLLAHSQGGLVARYYLETSGARLNSRRPHIDHLVTFSAPHQGAPLAGASEELAGSWSGKLALDGLSRAHDGRDPWPIPEALKHFSPSVPIADAVMSFATRKASEVVPDPYARSIQQMKPGSQFLTNLATDDVAFGTRVLAIQDGFDIVVAADHARWPGEPNRAVDGHPDKLLGGLNRHGGIVENPEPLAMAHSFLRGAQLPCLEEGDQEAWNSGRRIATTTDLLPDVWRLGEDAALSIALKGKGTTVKAVVREGSTLWRLLRARGLRGVTRYGKDKVTYVIRNPREVLEWLADQSIEAELQGAVEDMLEILVKAQE